MTGKSIIRAGMSRPSRQNQLYEQNATTPEEVAGRIGCRGTNDYDAKIIDLVGDIPLCVFGKNESEPPTVSSEPNDLYAANDQSCKTHELHNFFVFTGTLNDGDTSVKGKLLTAEVDTGKLMPKAATEIACGIAMKSVAASGADEDLETLFIGPLGGLSPVVITEAGTIDGETVTLTHTPISFQNITITTGDVANVDCIVGGVAVAKGALGVGICTLAGKVITFHADNTPTLCSITYSYLPGNE